MSSTIGATSEIQSFQVETPEQRLDDGRVRPIVRSVRPLAEAAAAFAPDQRVRGRTIITITEGG